MISFTAHCAKGHDRIDFTEPAAFEAHMSTEHKARKLRVGGRHTYSGRVAPIAPGEKPHPWKAPKVQPGEWLMERIAAGEYVWPGSHRYFDKPAAEATDAA